MKKTINMSGMGVITTNADNESLKFFEFLPDEPAPKLEKPVQTNGKLLMLRDGTACFTANKPRTRDNSLLICKLAHGRLSTTRDHAVQLTLKAFASEDIDWQRAFVVETVDAMSNLTGTARMNEILKEVYELVNRKGK